MIPTYPRIYPVRKPEGFKPLVQRWSVKFPSSSIHVCFFAVQASTQEEIAASGFLEWVETAFAGLFSPYSSDTATYIDAMGKINRVVTAYWADTNIWSGWKHWQESEGWWQSPQRMMGTCGFWREMLTVPIERIETIYWKDYEAAMCKNMEIEPTPYCGYFGAMRDRIPLAACDPLESSQTEVLVPLSTPRQTYKKRWFVTPPHNLAMIRSASFWGNCDVEQKQDYDTKLRDPLARGMQFLRDNPTESGCCELRFQQTLGVDDAQVPETHAHGYFLSLGHMEKWAEGHASHLAIFGAAMARYKKYGPINQLRTWHEVFILPKIGQHFEYINCHEKSGLLPYFDAVSF